MTLREFEVGFGIVIIVICVIGILHSLIGLK